MPPGIFQVMSMVRTGTARLVQRVPELLAPVSRGIQLQQGERSSQLWTPDQDPLFKEVHGQLREIVQQAGLPTTPVSAAKPGLPILWGSDETQHHGSLNILEGGQPADRNVPLEVAIFRTLRARKFALFVNGSLCNSEKGLASAQVYHDERTAAVGEESLTLHMTNTTEPTDYNGGYQPDGWMDRLGIKGAVLMGAYAATSRLLVIGTHSFSSLFGANQTAQAPDDIQSRMLHIAFAPTLLTQEQKRQFRENSERTRAQVHVIRGRLDPLWLGHAVRSLKDLKLTDTPENGTESEAPAEVNNPRVTVTTLNVGHGVKSLAPTGAKAENNARAKDKAA